MKIVIESEKTENVLFDQLHQRAIWSLQDAMQKRFKINKRLCVQGRRRSLQSRRHVEGEIR